MPLALIEPTESAGTKNSGTHRDEFSLCRNFLRDCVVLRVHFRTYLHISQGLIQYPGSAVRATRVNYKRRSRIENRARCACTGPHTDTPSQVPCGRMSGTRRVEGPFTIYRQKPMGFPSVYRGFSPVLSDPPTSGSLCEILERDSRRPCRGYAGEAEGEVGHVVGGVSEGVSWPTGLHSNLVLFRPAGSEGR